MRPPRLTYQHVEICVRSLCAATHSKIQNSARASTRRKSLIRFAHKCLLPRLTPSPRLDSALLHALRLSSPSIFHQTKMADCYRLFLFGARAWTRTRDRACIRRLLYQLSYTRNTELIYHAFIKMFTDFVPRFRNFLPKSSLYTEQGICSARWQKQR